MSNTNLTDICESLRGGIQAYRDELDRLAKAEQQEREVPCLEGSPCYIFIIENGVRKIYGQWSEGRGFKGDEFTPFCLSGALLSSRERAEKAVADLIAKGHNAGYSDKWAYRKERLHKLNNRIALAEEYIKIVEGDQEVIANTLNLG